jgi:putative hydrolase of the HAD superfamily
MVAFVSFGAVAVGREAGGTAAEGRGPKEALLLDALGTLVGMEPPWPHLESLLRERHGIALAPGDAQRAMRAEMDYYREHCASAVDRASLRELRLACADVLARELGVALDRDALAETLLDALRFEAYPEVAPTLRALRASGARIVVISNWDISLHDVLDRVGLRELLDGVLTSAELGVAKPAPAAFKAALQLAGVAPAAALHVGDSVEEDLAGARAAGIDVLLLVREPSRLLALGAAADPARLPDDATRIVSLSELAP